MHRVKFGISIGSEADKILHIYCQRENRNKSNMIEQMIKTYDTLHKSKY